MKKTALFLNLSILTLAASSTTFAGQPSVDAKSTPDAFTPFARGSQECQISVGGFFSLNNTGEKRPTINDIDTNGRIGWMLNDAAGSGILRGNCELLLEAYGAGVVSGPGHWFAGSDLLLRYNFVQPTARLVPYFQIGAGFLYNDIYQEQPQRRIGQGFEFSLQTGIGMRVMYGARCALFMEADFRHISNANNAERNLGLNSLGGLVGVSYFF